LALLFCVTVEWPRLEVLLGDCWPPPYDTSFFVVVFM
jgi:hypothetical protein